MAPRRKTFHEECQNLLKRYDGLDPGERERLQVYVTTLEERLGSVDYALSELHEAMYPSFPSATWLLDVTETGSGARQNEITQGGEKKRDFFANHFWAFTYSIFDVLAHIVNTVHPVVRDESEVSFSMASKAYKGISSKIGTMPDDILDCFKATTRRMYFKRLRKYRHCCLHRRSVCIFGGSATLKPSPGYDGSTSEIEIPVFWICDDPNEIIHPKCDKHRNLESECKRIRTGVEEDVVKCLRLLRG